MRAGWAPETTIKEANDVVALLTGPILGGLLRLHGIVSLHAAVVEVDGRAVALVGERGAGKSTIAAALAQRGHPVLSDDVAAINRDHHDRWIVYPGPPRLRIRREALHALPNPVDQAGPVMTGIDKGYVTLSTAPTAPAWRFRNEPSRLAAIIELRRHPEATAPRVEPVTGAAGLALLLTHTRTALAPLDPDMQARELERLSQLAVTVPVRRITCPDGSQGVGRTCEAIVGEILSVA